LAATAVFAVLAPAAIYSFVAVDAGDSRPPVRADGAPVLLVAPGGSDAGCARHAGTCGSLDGAYGKAAAGDVIEVAPGSYPPQRLSERRLGGRPVVVRAATPGTVSMAGLDVNTGSVTIEGVRLTRGLSAAPAHSESPSSVAGITIRDVHMPWAFIYADRLHLEGGSVGGFDACDTRNLEDGIEIWERNGVPTNGVSISGVVIHDVDGGRDGTCGGTAGAGRHVDCLQILGGQNVTIRNSVFTGCATSGVIARPYDGAQLGPMTIENNAFGRVLHPGSAIELGDHGGGDACTGPMIVRANTIVAGGVNGGCAGTSITVTSNILETGACSDGLVYSHNVFQTGWSARCGAGARACSVQYVQSADGLPSYHLARTDRCARNAGVASGAAGDIDGDVRPASQARRRRRRVGAYRVALGGSAGELTVGLADR
jgi:hypothetical protein